MTMGKVLPLFPDLAVPGVVVRVGDEGEAPVHEQLGFAPPRTALRSVPTPTTATPRPGDKQCRRCRNWYPILVSVGASVERTHCARCAGVVNSMANPRPYRGRR